MTVATLHTIPQAECAVCGGKGGKHELVQVPYPWPFNKGVFKFIPCLMEGLSV